MIRSSNSDIREFYGARVNAKFHYFLFILPFFFILCLSRARTEFLISRRGSFDKRYKFSH